MIFPNENQRITMVTGKGGVGKSVVAAALAQKYARQGFKTLLVELGEHSYFEHIYGKKITYQPTEISANFSVSIWSGQASLYEYVWHLLRVKKVVDLFFNNMVMKTFINAAPALKELAILGKITSGIRNWGPPLEYDRIVVDAFATGHFLALLRAPLGMSELIEAGPMGDQSRNINKVLKESRLCNYVIVTLAEELPITETVELSADLFAITGQQAEIFINKIYKCRVSPANLELAKMNSFTSYLKEYLIRQQAQFEKLKSTLAEIKPIPFIFSPIGRDVINGVEEALK